MPFPVLMMSNRNIEGAQLGTSVAQMRYFEYAAGPQNTLASWTKLKKTEFVRRLQGIAGNFPLLPDSRNEEQQHISVFVHGYNVSWHDSVTRYLQIKNDLFERSNLGCLLLFAWPSNGSPAAYLPDREDARASAAAFAAELVDLNRHVVTLQSTAARTNDPARACRAKVSIIAHSMGNYVIEKALAAAAKQLNSPQLVTLVTQLAMIAADVDNDLFQKDKPNDGDGSLMANLCYRITALYTGMDQVLGASAGLKHFGVRRLGRSGLADETSVWDNVAAKDVTAYLDPSKVVHSGVFDSPKALALLEAVLRGVDRGHFP